MHEPDVHHWRIPRYGHNRLSPEGLESAVSAALQTPEQVKYLTTKLEIIKQRSQLERLRRGFRIVVGGRIKAGKSTLLTALFGGQLQFPSAATVCTSVPTRIVRGHQGTRLIVTLKNDQTEIRLGSAALDQFATKDGCRSQDVECIRMEWDHEGFPDGLEVVDTPGSQDINQERNVLASEAVQNADLLLYAVAVSSGGAIQGPDFEAIRRFCRATEEKPLMVVLTMADCCSSPSEMKALVEQAQHHLHVDGFRNSTVVPCSALASLASLDFHSSLRGDSTPHLDPKCLRKSVKQRIRSMGFSDRLNLTLSSQIHLIQMHERNTPCFRTRFQCDHPECAWIGACIPKTSVLIASESFDSPVETMKSLRALQMYLGHTIGQEPNAKNIWYASNIGMVLDFLDGAWERAVERSENALWEMVSRD